ncbi:CLUMA_CG016131, isoform A [Clunio marinus]|uniref:CLUMA_CG016131, isoform A n=1 Tax=Clunio marinus TaxID=568069 RepID=A0A1J1IUI8_9DIPT|nr:CLUMA_CG016131, isoform A [Clunio marinus]
MNEANLTFILFEYRFTIWIHEISRKFPRLTNLSDASSRAGCKGKLNPWRTAATKQKDETLTIWIGFSELIVTFHMRPQLVMLSKNVTQFANDKILANSQDLCYCFLFEVLFMNKNFPSQVMLRCRWNSGALFSECTESCVWWNIKLMKNNT